MGRALRTAVVVTVAGTASFGGAQERPEVPNTRPAASLCGSPATPDRIDSVTASGELRLSSGRVVRLAGIRRPAERILATQAAAFLAEQSGNPVDVAAVRTEPDRWGRLPAIVTVTGEAGPIDLGRNLVAAGLGLVDAGEEDALCQPDLFATEQRARDAGLGLWREERYKPVVASDIERLLALTGRFAVVEGRIRSIGERSERTYINFGEDWSKNLTITIPKRTWRRMVDAGISAAKLRGRRVRARGVIERWNGPQITMTAPEMIEKLDEGLPGRR